MLRGGRTGDRGLEALDLVHEHPRDHAGRRGHVGVEEGLHRQPVRLERRARVEAKPAEPGKHRKEKGGGEGRQ